MQSITKEFYVVVSWLRNGVTYFPSSVPTHMHPSGMNVSPAADWSVNVRILIESISSSVSASELQLKLRY